MKRHFAPLLLSLILSAYMLLAGKTLAEETLAENRPETTQTPEDGAPSGPPVAPANNTEPPPPPAQPPKRLEVQRGQWLIKQLETAPDSRIELRWFHEGSDQQYLGLYTPEYSSEPQGYALILHDNQQHPNWPGIVSSLREQLPAGGWSTLAISLPDYWLLPIVPERAPDDTIISLANSPTNSSDTAAMPDSAASGNEVNSASDESVTPQESQTAPTAARFTQLSVEFDPAETPQIMRSRVQEGLEFLRDRDPMPIIIVAIGSSATLIAKQAHEMRMKDIAGLVIIDPVNLPNSDTNPNEDVAGLRIPVLDIAPEFNARTPAIERKKNALRQSRKTYEQHIVMGADPGFNQSESQVVKKIRGWANRVILDKSRFGYL
ncbi:MAG: alpha/beta hydrolase family protein [Pseudomonadales bacterium]|nr:alpha/beta hydrolase family protein [Pseudomonadales bacterium]